MKKSWLLLAILVALPVAAHAEIYKWKDKDGVVRYSDVPPASNVPHETLSGKSAIPTPAPQPAPAAAAPSAANPDEAAAKRQQSAEQDKAQQQASENDQQAKKQNCMNAQSNMQKYKVGGRIMKVNEKGEREYLSDADIKQGLEQAQKEIEQFCPE
jgi:hypothetical protein